MSKSSNQRGEGRVGLLIALAICGIGIFLAVKILPVKITAIEFRDYMEQECRMAAVRQNNAELQKRIMEKASALEVPLQSKNLVIKRVAGEMVIKAKYEQPIDLKVTTYVYKFDHEERAPLF